MKSVLSKIKGLFHKKSKLATLNNYSTAIYPTYHGLVGASVAVNGQQLGSVIQGSCANVIIPTNSIAGISSSLPTFPQQLFNPNYAKELGTLKNNILKQEKSIIKNIVELNVDEVFYTEEHRVSLAVISLEVTEETPEEILYLYLLGCKLSKTDLDKVLFACRFEYPILVKYVKELNKIKQAVTL